MALLLADVTDYQGALTLAQLQAAGQRAISVKTSHGLTQRAVHPRAGEFLAGARTAGMGLASCHWLTGDASGVDQANYAYRCLIALGLHVPGAAHIVDVEAGPYNVGGEPKQHHYVDYCVRMTQLLGRPIVTYSGKWWTDAHPWLTVNSLSPWLMGAPAGGYLDSYPGDSADQWENGYAGWAALSIMQYRVAPIAGIDVSQSAIRSADVWQDMTGGIRMAWSTIPAADTLTAEMNAAFPERDKASDGSIGDGEHSTRSSDHNPDETGTTPSEDSDTFNEVHAKDLDSDLKRKGWTLKRVFEIMRKRAAAGQEKRIQNMICDGEITSASWGFSEWRDYTGTDPHDTHGHVSFKYGSGGAPGNPEQITTPYGILAAVRAEEDDMSAEDVAAIKAHVTSEVAKAVKATTDARTALTTEVNAVPAEVFGFKYGDPAFPNRTLTTFVKDEQALRDYMIGGGNPTGAGALVPRVGSWLDVTGKAAVGAPLDVDEEALARALIGPLSAALTAALPEGTLTSEQVQAAAEAAFRTVLRTGIGTSEN